MSFVFSVGEPRVFCHFFWTLSFFAFCCILWGFVGALFGMIPWYMLHMRHIVAQPALLPVQSMCVFHPLVTFWSPCHNTEKLPLLPAIPPSRTRHVEMLAKASQGDCTAVAHFFWWFAHVCIPQIVEGKPLCTQCTQKTFCRPKCLHLLFVPLPSYMLLTPHSSGLAALAGCYFCNPHVRVPISRKVAVFSPSSFSAHWVSAA